VWRIREGKGREEDRKERGGKKSRNTSLPSIPAYPCRALHSTNELYFAKKNYRT